MSADNASAAVPTPRKRLQGAAILAYAIPAAVVAALIGVLVAVQGNAEASLAEFAGALPIGFAAAAGLVASVNPCGFFMLPSYIAYQLGTEEAGYNEIAAPLRVARALGVAITATLGFVLIFVAFGAVVSAGGSALGQVFPYLGLAIGARDGWVWRLPAGLAPLCGDSCGQPHPGDAAPQYRQRVRLRHCLRRRLAQLYAADLHGRGGRIAGDGGIFRVPQPIPGLLARHGSRDRGRDAGRGAVPRRHLALAARARCRTCTAPARSSCWAPGPI